LKGLVIHTADECGGATGPDYTFGWGLVNTLAAATHITQDQSTPGVMQELVLPDGQNLAETWTYSGAGPIRATISWTDPPAQPLTPAVDPPTKMLVNDLDLRITGPDATVYLPWVLKPAIPANPATTGDNISDNVEMVLIPSPDPGDYVVSVTHKGTLTDGMQPYSLLLTGLTNGPQVLGACCDGETCTGTNSQTDCATAGGTWYGGTSCASFTCPPLGGCCTGCPPNETCTEVTEVDCNVVDGHWYADTACVDVNCDNPGDDCDTEMRVVVDGLHPFDNRCATTDGPPSVSCDNGTQAFSNDLWYAYTSSCTGTLTVDLCADTNYDAIIAIYENQSAVCPCPTDASTQYGDCSDDSCGVSGGPPVIIRAVVAGQCYTIRVGGWNGTRGFGSMLITCSSVEQLPPPTGGNETCFSGTTNLGTPCSANADCGAGEVCSLNPRYVGVTPTNPLTAGGAPSTIQVTIASMAQFPSHVGEVWWAGTEGSVNNPPGSALRGAQVQCSTNFDCAVGHACAQVWTAGPLYLYGTPIVPNATYEIRMCNAAGGSCSVPLIVGTSIWGNVVAPHTAANFADISAVVDKFRALATSVAMPRADLVGTGNPGQPSTPNQTANFADVSAAVDAFRTIPYPFTVPECP